VRVRANQTAFLRHARSRHVPVPGSPNPHARFIEFGRPPYTVSTHSELCVQRPLVQAVKARPSPHRCASTPTVPPPAGQKFGAARPQRMPCATPIGSRPRGDRTGREGVISSDCGAPSVPALSVKGAGGSDELPPLGSQCKDDLSSPWSRTGRIL
jgi:hypothetical protein